MPLQICQKNPKKKVTLEEQKVVTLLCYYQLVIENQDELKDTPIYVHEIKKQMRFLEKLLSKKVDYYFKEDDSASAANQLVEVCGMIHKVVIAMLKLDPIHHQSFDTHLRSILAMHHLDEETLNELFETESI